MRSRGVWSDVIGPGEPLPTLGRVGIGLWEAKVLEWYGSASAGKGGLCVCDRATQAKMVCGDACEGRGKLVKGSEWIVAGGCRAVTVQGTGWMEGCRVCVRGRERLEDTGYDSETGYELV